jgi:hypothetical protein
VLKQVVHIVTTGLQRVNYQLLNILGFIQSLCQIMQSSFPNHDENMVVVASNDISMTWPAKQMVLVSHGWFSQ